MRSQDDVQSYFVSIDGKRYVTHSKSRFLRHTGTIKWKKSTVVYVRVTYEKGKDKTGKFQVFFNDADVTNKKELEGCIKAFLDI